MKPVEIKIKYFTGMDSETEKPLPPEFPLEKIEKGNWIDLRSNMTIEYQEGDEFVIPLGVAMELPDGYEAHIVPRSSLFIHYGLIMTNHFGVVDTSYCGDDDEWQMYVKAFRNGGLSKGDRVCQFRIVEEQPEIKFTQVEELGNKNRGGFGSTGMK